MNRATLQGPCQTFQQDNYIDGIIYQGSVQPTYYHLLTGTNKPHPQFFINSKPVNPRGRNLINLVNGLTNDGYYLELIEREQLVPKDSIDPIKEYLHFKLLLSGEAAERDKISSFELRRQNIGFPFSVRYDGDRTREEAQKEVAPFLDKVVSLLFQGITTKYFFSQNLNGKQR